MGGGTFPKEFYRISPPSEKRKRVLPYASRQDNTVLNQEQEGCTLLPKSNRLRLTCVR